MSASPPSVRSDDLAPQRDAAPQRCVLVDDDAYFLKLMEVLVVRARPDFQLIAFSEPLRALEFLSHDRADLIITDIRMPVMNGFQLTAAIRALHATVPIIAISSEEFEEKALAHGANAFLSKNVVNAQLGPLIARLCAPA